MVQTMQEKPKGPLFSALAEVELAIFLLDGSGSMCKPEEGATKTYDRRTKATHLFEIMRETLGRMHTSTKSSAFRVALIYFSEEATTEEIEVGEARTTYFTPGAALEVLKVPCEVTHGGKTSIVSALSEAQKVLDAVSRDDGLPANKFATIFLLTDGQETVQTAKEVREELGKLRTHSLSPTVAVVSFGLDADDALLVDIANEPTERQVRHLELQGVLGLISQEPRRLHLKGHSEGEVTKQQAEAIRNFLNILTETIAQQGQEKPKG